MISQYQCVCGGPMVPVRVGVCDKDGFLIGTVCFRQTCRKCGNSRLTPNSKVLFYSITDLGRFNFDPMQFWTPSEVPYGGKQAFLRAILGLVDRFGSGHQLFTMDQIRQAYQAKHTYGEDRL